MLMHDGQVVVGPVATWVRETLQNMYSTRYLSAQTAGLYVCAESGEQVREGSVLMVDGERWQVRAVAGQQVRCRLIRDDAEMAEEAAGTGTGRREWWEVEEGGGGRERREEEDGGGKWRDLVGGGSGAG